MKVLGFNGSPRANGNTYILLKHIADELKNHDIEMEIIHVGAKQLSGCISCGKCGENKNKKCVISNDPINGWIEKMLEADGIILGSPVYCAGLSAQIKAFMDRTSIVACMNDDMLKRKVGASIVAVRRAGAVQTFNSLNSYFSISQMIQVGSTYWNMGFGMTPGEVEQDAEGLQTMRNLAQNMAWLLKCIDNAKGKIVPDDTKRAVMTNFIR